MLELGEKLDKLHDYHQLAASGTMSIPDYIIKERMY